MLLPGPGPYSIQDSAATFEAQLDPLDPALRFFDCGDDDTALAINAFFQQGKWTRIADMVALRFVMSGARFGYAAVVLTQTPHPDSTGAAVEEYLAIWMLGVDRAFHGTPDPGSSTGARLADAVMKGCQAVALSNAAAGIILHVRDANLRAQALYRRNGFTVDPRGPFADRRGITMLEMRKLLAAP
jgi:ribosomal protein S18 acetylase RimI-like enzyme